MENLTLQNVRKSYGNNKVLKDINCSMNPGIHGFLGANGVGKSTLFSIISGYIDKDGGTVSYPDFDKDNEVLISILPQRFQGYPDMSIEEFMEYMGTLKLPHISKRILQSDIDEKLEIFGLIAFRKKKLKKLSGGQLRRVGIAQAFQFNPKIVLLDEPTTGLDPSERVKFKNYIAEAAKNEIILLSTHIVSDLEQISKDIYILKGGVFIALGSEEELLNSCSGNVWEMSFESEDEMSRMLSEDQISMIFERHGKISARYLSEVNLDPRSVPVKPELNDVYIKYFRKESQL